MSSFPRNRSDTVDTAGTLTSVEKARLLEEMPSYHDDDDGDDNDDEEVDVWGEGEDGQMNINMSAAGGNDNDKAVKKPTAKPSNDDSDSDDDSLWGDADQDDTELHGATRSELQSRQTHKQFLKERGWKSHKQLAREAERRQRQKPQEKPQEREATSSKGGDWQPAKKRRKTGRESLDGTTLVVRTEHETAVKKSDPSGADDNVESVDAATLDAAKSRLSKWAQRLFDPDRPRGVIQTPEIIPMNDEFLTAFGKREKEMDETKKKAGGENNGSEDGKAKEENLDAESDSMTPTSNTTKAKKNCKIKITNLAYTTTSRTIISTFTTYGDVVAVHLVPDPNNPYQSLGRGYVTYNEADEAQRATEEMDGKRLDGRLLRIGIAADKPGGGTKKRRRSMDDNGGNGGGGGGDGADLLAGDAGGRAGGHGAKPSDRYWDKDISTKCFNCGEVGHRSDSCPNPTKVPPCNLCGNVTVADGTAQGPHDSWSCPYKAICFNCGVPGHVARDCPENRGGRGRGAPPPRRVVCGRCYRSGHHRWQCTTRNAQRVSQHEAQCQIPSCGRRGHFSCRKMGWFFGLRGTYCFNCGRKGHQGMSCDRPKLDDCARNPELAEDEIDEAGLESLHEEMDEREKGRDRSHDRGRDHSRDRSRSTERHGGGGGGRSRAKSQPPPREAGRYNEGRRRSSGGGGGGRNQQRGYGGGGGGRRGYR